MATFAALEKNIYTTAPLAEVSKIKDYAKLVKFRLSFLVVISAISGYAFAVGFRSLEEILWLCLGGFLVTASSNTFNQIIEREIDKKMKRTADRPLPSGRMGVPEAMVIAILTGTIGTLVLWFQCNPKTAWLGLLSLVMYVVIYTPMKRVSSWCVFAGAFPGAMPPLLGYVAATNELGFIPGILFFIQFVWQFPHFWAIAWVGHDDYQKAGYKMLPSNGGRNKFTSMQILLYTICLIIISLLPYLLFQTGAYAEQFGFTVGHVSMIIVALSGLMFYWYAFKLHASNELSDAKKLMFASFVYLPIVQFAYVFDKVLI